MVPLTALPISGPFSSRRTTSNCSMVGSTYRPESGNASTACPLNTFPVSPYQDGVGVPNSHRRPPACSTTRSTTRTSERMPNWA